MNFDSSILILDTKNLLSYILNFLIIYRLGPFKEQNCEKLYTYANADVRKVTLCSTVFLHFNLCPLEVVLQRNSRE